MLGAVIVAFRDPAALDRCLRSLTTISEVIVVNVTDDPGVEEVCQRFGRQVLAVLTNVGYAAAVNEGVRHLPAAVDVVLFANDDVEVSVGALDGGAGVSVPLHRLGDHWKAPLHPLPTPSQFFRHWILGGGVVTPPGVPLPAGLAANGAALIADRAILEQHPLPEEYFLYWEETAWFWRLHCSGVPVHIEPSFCVRRPPGGRELSRCKARLMGENLIRIGVERYGRPARVLYLLLGLLWIGRVVVTDVWRVRAWSALPYRFRTATGVLRAAVIGCDQAARPC